MKYIILHYLQPLKKYGTIVSIEELCFCPTVHFKKILKFRKFEKSTKNLFQIIARICNFLRYT